MALVTIDVEVDGIAYQIGQLPWLAGVPVYRTIVRCAGDSLVATLLKMTAEERKALAAGDRKATMPFAMRIIGAMTDEDTRTVVNGLGSVVSVKVGDTDVYEPVLGLREHFSGRYLHLVKVLWEAAAHNFSDPT